MDLVRSGTAAHVRSMITLRSAVFIATLVVASLARADRPTASGAHGFDFELGEWRVHHRLKRASGEWWEFDGTARIAR